VKETHEAWLDAVHAHSLATVTETMPFPPDAVKDELDVEAVS